MSNFDRSWDIYFNHYRPDVLFPEVIQPQKGQSASVYFIGYC